MHALGRLAIRFVCLALTFASATAFAANGWTITLLPGVGNDAAMAKAVNDRGDIVGDSYPLDPATGRSGAPRATLWVNGVAQDLGNGEAFDVNAGGTIAGTHFPGGESLWTNGQWAALGVGLAGFPLYVNNAGVVASSYPYSGDPHAYTWNAGVVTDLGTLGGTESQAFAINARGAVVGYSHITGDTAIHPFLYEAGTMYDLGTLGRLQGKALGINDRGVVVGYVSERFDAAPIAFIDDGVMRPLFAGAACCSIANAINARGDVVGVINGQSGFVVQDGVVTMLDQLPAVRAAGWTRLLPQAINNRGWIVGMGLVSGPVAQGRVPWRAFVLKPRG